MKERIWNYFHSSLQTAEHATCRRTCLVNFWEFGWKNLDNELLENRKLYFREVVEFTKSPLPLQKFDPTIRLQSVRILKVCDVRHLTDRYRQSINHDRIKLSWVIWRRTKVPISVICMNQGNKHISTDAQIWVSRIQTGVHGNSLEKFYHKGVIGLFC